MKDLNKAKHIKHPDLCNAVAASARIDEAIESMVPDQFEILLYKKNSEYSYINPGDTENTFVCSGSCLTNRISPILYIQYTAIFTSSPNSLNIVFNLMSF